MDLSSDCPDAPSHKGGTLFGCRKRSRGADKKLNEGGERLCAPGPEKVDYKDGGKKGALPLPLFSQRADGDARGNSVATEPSGN
jgi:hypothetical protein